MLREEGTGNTKTLRGECGGGVSVSREEVCY